MLSLTSIRKRWKVTPLNLLRFVLLVFKQSFWLVWCLGRPKLCFGLGKCVRTITISQSDSLFYKLCSSVLCVVRALVFSHFSCVEEGLVETVLYVFLRCELEGDG